MLSTRTFVFNPFSENTFVIYDEESREAAIVDPGCIEKNEQDELDDFINENDLKMKYIVLTHGHVDHMMGSKYVKEKYDAELLAPEKDMPLLNMAPKQGEAFQISISPPPEPDIFIIEDKEIKLGENTGRFLFTPGHTPGEYCLVFDNARICFTGDVIFRDSIGRTDLWGGDYDELMKSIREKVLTLPEDYTLYPGHGPETTVEYEKNNNPFIK